MMLAIQYEDMNCRAVEQYNSSNPAVIGSYHLWHDWYRYKITVRAASSCR
jgi:hypothetical protein